MNHAREQIDRFKAEVAIMADMMKKENLAMKKRVRIAKDVILQMDAGHIAPRQGAYFGNWMDATAVMDASPRAGDVGALLKKVKECEVCAIGALFVAAVERYDHLTFPSRKERADTSSFVTPGIAGTKADRRLKDFFPERMLRSMENSFERFKDVPPALTDLCYQKSPRAGSKLYLGIVPIVLRAIMWNVIDNGGNFKPAGEWRTTEAALFAKVRGGITVKSAGRPRRRRQPSSSRRSATA